MQAIAAAAIKPISQFGPPLLASTAWAVSELVSSNWPLRDALASQSRATIASVGAD